MARYQIIWWIFLLCNGLLAKNLSIEEIITSQDFRVKTLSGVQWIPQQEAFTYLKTENDSRERLLIRVDARSGEETVLLSEKELSVLEAAKSEKRFTLPSYRWAPDGRHILIPSENELFLIDTNTKSVKQLTKDGAAKRDPLFSPDAKKIAYLREKNLHVLDIANGTEKQLTFDGSDNILIGRFDWVYEEEFSIRTGFQWSPDSRRIAFFRLDQTNVPDYTINNIIPIYSEPHTMKYPKAGDTNSTVRIGIVDIESGNMVWADREAGPDSYISRIQWNDDGTELALVFLNRDQNSLQLLFANAETGTTRTILTETVENGWLEPKRTPLFFKDNNQFIWESEQDGFNHLYLYSPNGKLLRQLTRGEWDVRGIAGISEQSKRIYFLASPEKPEEQHLFSVKLNGRDLYRLTKEPGSHGASMSESGSYFIDSFSNWETPTLQMLKGSDGKLIKKLNDNRVAALDTTKLATIRFFTLTTSQGFDLPGFLLKPADFDSSKKYPVLIYCYGGPGSQIVNNRWFGTRAFWYTLLTQKGYLICAVDGRGTANRGRDWKHLLYKKLGDIEIQDQIETAKYLGSLPYVDSNRIGIWGWSYGGYTTVMALLKGADTFKAGIAVAPVTDWRNYDTIYTERFMDQPEDNEDGYNNGAAVNFAKNLTGRLLLIHGCADDNVHLSNTWQLAEAFQRHRIQFDMMIYPNKFHGIGGVDEHVHLYTKMTDYILSNL